ncbi:uncharacterized protein T551_00425 [Pneumocystis jirovecii RU7]|uniref:Uncharacterized protein n=1 Tax=Pneumocystis jirovecii (strain RU7) TaxID=1408657 RepID=A0A0W4ZVE3_PNEJ7|nr:uncharacterized protein T551_00425 [Pneumocystis jirovecii RU7]KTW32335.1 hypothetical protein T551_00425 [Pneumocystis jirovecii RU7]
MSDDKLKKKKTTYSDKKRKQTEAIEYVENIEFNESIFEKDSEGNFIYSDKASDLLEKLLKRNVSISSVDFMFIWVYVDEEPFLHEVANILEVKKPYKLREWYANGIKFLSLDIRNLKFVNDIKKCVGWDDATGCNIKTWTRYWLPPYITNQNTSNNTRKNKRKKK